jgi:hypothetical protein
MADIEQALSGLNFSEVGDHLTNGQNNLAGSDYPPGHFTGVPLSETPKSFCTLNQWIEDNTPFRTVFQYDFESFRSTVSLRIYRKSNGNLVKTLGPFNVTGRESSNGNFGVVHYRHGLILMTRLTQWVENKLNE